MSIAVGGQITAIIERSVTYGGGGGDPPETLYIRDMTFKMVGMPPEVDPPPVFTIAVTDATQWNTLQVGQTCTITIEPPA